MGGLDISWLPSLAVLDPVPVWDRLQPLWSASDRAFVEGLYLHLLGRLAELDATGRLFIVPGDDLQADSKVSLIPDLPVQYIRSSDMQMVAAHKADSYDQTHLLHGRLEGEFAALVACLDEGLEDVALVCTGPWPPYSFTQEGSQ